MELKQEEIERVNNLTGSPVISSEGDKIGFITGLLSISESASNQDNPEYIIVGSDLLDDSSSKYFAVPAYTELFDLSNSESIVKARFNKETLVRAKRISVDRCPTPFDYEPLIYELTDFAVSQKEGAGC